MHSFTFNGKNSREYCELFVSGGDTFNAPSRDIESIPIPGRNGELTIDHGRYLNTELIYSGWIAKDFFENARKARNWLCSTRGYKRLEDDYHTDEFRMARFIDGLQFNTIAGHVAGGLDIRFDCMPQRWLKSGEVPVDGSGSDDVFEAAPVISFENPAGNKTISSLLVSITAQQSGKGDPSPSNIRPITGWTGAKLYLYDADGNYQTDVTPAIIRHPQNQEASAGDDVSFTVVTIGTGYTYQWQVFNPSIGEWRNSTSGGNKTATLIVGKITDARITYRYRCLVSKGGVTLVSAPAMMYYTGTPEPDVVVDYEPDYAPLVSVNWQTEAGTIAGGYLDVTTGLLTVTYGYMLFDGTEEWKAAGDGNSRLFRHTVVGERINPTGRLCSHYRSVTVTMNDSSVGYFSYSQDDSPNGLIQFRPENVADTTLDDWKNWLAEQSSNGTPVQITYKHETPVTYQLSTTEVTTLLGQNNIFSNTGDISATIHGPTDLENPTEEVALPKIDIKGNGAASITINDRTISISEIGGEIILDSEIERAYLENTVKDSFVSGSYFKLTPGHNYVTYTGDISEITIIPRWWRL